MLSSNMASVVPFMLKITSGLLRYISNNLHILIVFCADKNPFLFYLPVLWDWKWSVCVWHKYLMYFVLPEIHSSFLYLYCQWTEVPELVCCWLHSIIMVLHSRFLWWLKYCKLCCIFLFHGNRSNICTLSDIWFTKKPDSIVKHICQFPWPWWNVSSPVCYLAWLTLFYSRGSCSIKDKLPLI